MASTGSGKRREKSSEAAKISSTDISYQDFDYFRVRLPEGIRWERKLRADFCEYWFYSKAYDDPILYACDAGFPRFPLKAPLGTPIHRIRIGDLFADSMEWSGDNNTFSREVLVILRPNTAKRPPILVHFIYLNASDFGRKLADQIVESTQRVFEEESE